MGNTIPTPGGYPYLDPIDAGVFCKLSVDRNMMKWVSSDESSTVSCPSLCHQLRAAGRDALARIETRAASAVPNHALAKCQQDSN